MGLLNPKGTWVLEPIYAELELWREGRNNKLYDLPEKTLLLKVGIDGQYRLIDYTGEKWVDIKFDKSIRFYLPEKYQDYVEVQKDGKYRLCRLKKLDTPNEFYDRLLLKSAKFVIVKDGKEIPAEIDENHFLKY